MNVKNVEQENGNAKVTVEIGKEEFETALSKAYAKAKKNIAVPGFRKGKVPRKIVEGMYGNTAFYDDAIEEIFPDIYTAAFVDQKLKAVGQPSIAHMETPDEGGVVLTVATGLYPEVTLGQYKSLEVPKAAVEVTEEEVENELDRMAKQNARISTVERPAQEGDTVVLDFEGFVDGAAFEGGKGENHSLVLGSGQFIPGFEEQLVGLSAGDNKDVVVTFPEQYDPKLAGKQATFHCAVHEVKEAILPEKDDEFAKDISEFDTIDELRENFKARILQEKEDGTKSAFENACVAKAVENMTAEIPACMIEEQLDKQIEEFGYQLQRNGMSMDDYTKMMGGDTAKLRDSFRPMAENNVKANILLAQIAEEEKLEASDEEVEAEVKKLAAQYQMEEDKVREYLPADAMKSDLCTRKAVQLIADSAIPTKPEAPAEEKTKESAEEKPE
ncbi:MAG: trigger factor [Oscillospiraceae bacterium]|nr:trigger factor [Oscillospiraceae bacterium]